MPQKAMLTLPTILLLKRYSSGGYSEELSLPQPDESTLMRLYFQCDQAGLSAILLFFKKCHEENEENQGLEPVLIDRELAHCFGVFLHRQKHANKLNKNRSFLSRFLGLPISQFVIEKVARKSWPMFVDIFKEGTARNYQTLYDRSCAIGLQKTSWDSYGTFVDDYQALDFLAPGDMADAWLSDYTISLWCFMMSMLASQTVHIFYPVFYEYLSSDKEEYRKSINFDFTMTPKRRLFIIPINLGGSHWAVNLVFHASNGHYSATQLDPMTPKRKFPSEKESLLLAEFFCTDTDKKNPIIQKNRYLEMCFSSFPIQKDSINCGVFVCFYVCWISQHGSKLKYKLDKEHDETSAGLSARAIKNEFGSFVSGMCSVKFRKEYANFIKVLREKYNQLGIEGVEGKVTDVLTHDYGGDNSKLVDVWSKNIEKRTTEDTELKSENTVSTSYKTKVSMTNSAQKSKSGIPKVSVLVKGKPVDSFNNNEADGFKDDQPRGMSYRNRANRFKDDHARGDVNRVTISRNI
eukprot:jgi/Psemu1/38841/gm1.38841_g